MRIRTILAITLITTILISCGLPLQDSQTPLTPTPTLEGLSGGPAPTPSPDDSNTLQATPTIPVDTSLEAPLSENGPWLLLAMRDDTNNTSGFYTANPDGTGLTFIFGDDLIEEQVTNDDISDEDVDVEESKEDEESIEDESSKITPIKSAIQTYAISPNNDILAILTKDSTSTMTLWLLALPNGEIIQALPLIGPQAQQAILDNQLYIPYKYFYQGLNKQISPKLFPVSFLWSPDGQNIALSAAFDGPSTDVYIYGVFTEILSRITSGPGQSVLMGWSPDNQWVIHQGTSSFPSQFQAANGVYAASVNGEIIFLYEPSPTAADVIVGWISNSTFLNYSKPFGLPATQLRNTDINTQTTFIQLEGIFQSAVYNSETNIVLIELFGFPNYTPAVAPGTFRYLPNSGEINTILPPGYPLVKWVPELGLFAAAQRLTQSNIIYFNRDGNIQVTIPRFHPSIIWPTPSPDGSWIISPSRDGHTLYSSAGDLITSVVGSGQVHWYPDSTGFVIYTNSGTIIEFLLNGEWHPTIINQSFLINAALYLFAP